MIRVLIADDQALFREGLRTALTALGVDVVGVVDEAAANAMSRIITCDAAGLTGSG